MITAGNHRMVLILVASLLLLTALSSSTISVNADTSTLTKLQSGLVAYDSLATGTTSYWRFYGSAVGQQSNYSSFENSQGLYVGVQAVSPGVWAGYYAISPYTSAQLFHTEITLPNSTIPAYSADSGFYVQSSGPEINGIACGAGVNQEGYFWEVDYDSGNTNYVTQINTAYFEWWSPGTPLTRDCTIITNGQNLLQVFLDNQQVFFSDSLNLQMQSPFNAFLEEQSTNSNLMLYGIFNDYYATTSGMVSVVGAQPGYVAEVLSANNAVLGSGTVGPQGDALIAVSQYSMPISGYVELLNGGGSVVAESALTSIWGGDIYGQSGTASSQLTVATQIEGGTQLLGMYTVLYQNQNVVATGFSPMTFNLTDASTYTVEVQNYGDMVFDHWLDSSSTSADRTVSILGDTNLIAVYRNSSSPPPPTQSVINVSTVNSGNQTITGYYTTLWVGGIMTESCFSPCTFFVSNGGSYQVGVSDYAGVSFNHWSDGVTNRLHNVVVGSASTEINLVAVYTP